MDGAASHPPRARSRAALGLAVQAIRARFALQVCSGCGCVQYPPADLCRLCLCDDLPWRDLDPGGTLLARTEVHASIEPYFRARGAWPIGIVQLDTGPRIVAHLAADCVAGARVALSIRLDAAGRGVVLADRFGARTDRRCAFSETVDGICVLHACDSGGTARAIIEAMEIFDIEMTAVDSDAGATALRGRIGDETVHVVILPAGEQESGVYP